MPQNMFYDDERLTKIADKYFHLTKDDFVQAAITEKIARSLYDFKFQHNENQGSPNNPIEADIERIIEEDMRSNGEGYLDLDVASRQLKSPPTKHSD